MLTIRMQRTGRKGHAQFRVVVQDSRFSPTSGRVVAQLGSYDPHSKTTTLDKDKAKDYLANGAQPSDRVIRLLKAEGVKVPGWVSPSAPKKHAIRNQDKLRRNRPDEPKAVETLAAEGAAADEAPATVTDVPAEAGPTAAEAAPAPEADAKPESSATEEAPAAAENS